MITGERWQRHLKKWRKKMNETASEAGGAVSPTDADAAVTEAKQALEAAEKVQVEAHATNPPPDAQPPVDPEPPADETAEPTVAEFADAANALRGLGQARVAGFLDRTVEAEKADS
jgi:hypothetical protein